MALPQILRGSERDRPLRTHGGIPKRGELQEPLDSGPMHAGPLLRSYYSGSSAETANRRFPNPLAQLLENEARRIASAVCARQVSEDGTTKLLLRMGDGRTVESVMMPDYRADRAAGCISSQVGCAMGCDFCATTKTGFERNLTSGEIGPNSWRCAGKPSPSAGASRRSSSWVWGSRCSTWKMSAPPSIEWPATRWAPWDSGRSRCPPWGSSRELSQILPNSTGCSVSPPPPRESTPCSAARCDCRNGSTSKMRPLLHRLCRPLCASAAPPPSSAKQQVEAQTRPGSKSPNAHIIAVINEYARQADYRRCIPSCGGHRGRGGFSKSASNCRLNRISATHCPWSSLFHTSVPPSSMRNRLRRQVVVQPKELARPSPRSLRPVSAAATAARTWSKTPAPPNTSPALRPRAQSAPR